MLADIPVVFKYHVFTCFQQRPAGHPRGSCMGAGAKPLWERLQGRLTATPNPDVSVTATGCLGFCRAGPLMVVYPEGTWYHGMTADKIPHFVQQHLLEGKPIAEWIFAENQLPNACAEKTNE